MKRLKIIYLCIFLLAAAAALAACGATAQQQPGIEAVVQQQPDSDTATDTDVSDAEAEPEESDEPEQAEDITIFENVLFDADYIRVTARGLENSWLGTDLQVLIENDSDVPITIQARDVVINGIMFDGVLFSASVTPGNRSNDSITFSSNSLERNGIEVIGTIQLSLRIIDDDNWENSFTADPVIIETSASGTFVQQLPETVKTVFEQDGIRIEYMGFEETWLGESIVFLITNDTNESITIQTREEAINGFMVSGIMSTEVLPGKVAIGDLTFGSWELEENDIEEIEYVEFRFRVIHEDWNLSFETDLIRLAR